ncbi:MAG TPA: DUF5681 domain-containing protein [Flavisolibacter sp.]|nr:DUF5681 domain-containing protein [Flavisolibacter sp.]
MNKKPKIENLRPFKKGESGNPKGRPPKLPDLDVLMAEVLGEEKDGKTAAQAILAALRAKAAKGDIRAAEVLLNRGYGLPKQKIEHSSDPDNPVIFQVDGRFKDTTGDDS